MHHAARKRQAGPAWWAVTLDSGPVVAARVRRAGTLLERAVGLMTLRSLPPGEGLWIDPCAGVHTLGMRFPIDVVFLDPDLSILRVAEAVPPGRVRLAPRGTRSVLELPARAAAEAGLRPGIRLRIQPHRG